VGTAPHDSGLRLAALGCHAAGGGASVGTGVLYLASSE
jgi:hypothetical protein